MDTELSQVETTSDDDSAWHTEPNGIHWRSVDPEIQAQMPQGDNCPRCLFASDLRPLVALVLALLGIGVGAVVWWVMRGG